MNDILSQLDEIQGNVRDIKATWGNTIMTLDNIKSSLKADRQKAIEEAYQKGFEAGQHEATTLEYQQGLDDAWECARRLVWETSLNEAEHMGFIAEEESAEILRDYTVTAAMKAVELYDEKLKAEIKVGDEVRSKVTGCIGTVIKPNVRGDSDYMYLLYDDGSMGKYLKSEYRKTGRHFHYAEKLLNEMRVHED